MVNLHQNFKSARNLLRFNIVTNFRYFQIFFHYFFRKFIINFAYLKSERQRVCNHYRA